MYLIKKQCPTSLTKLKITTYKITQQPGGRNRKDLPRNKKQPRSTTVMVKQIFSLFVSCSTSNQSISANSIYRQNRLSLILSAFTFLLLICQVRAVYSQIYDTTLVEGYGLGIVGPCETAKASALAAIAGCPAIAHYRYYTPYMKGNKLYCLASSGCFRCNQGGEPLYSGGWWTGDIGELGMNKCDNTCPSGLPDPNTGRCEDPKVPPCNLPCSGAPNDPPPTGKANPINITTGNKYQVETDYTDASLSGLAFIRTYNSLSIYSDDASGFLEKGRAIGIMWRHNYSQQLRVRGNAGSQQVTISRSNGRKLTFTEQATGFTSDADITSKLNKTFSAGMHDGWEYHPSTTVTETYNLSGQLTGIQKANGHNLIFHYGTDGIPETLDRVDDFEGRSIQLHYDANRQIDYIIAPNGQQINYAYDIRRLKTVTNTTTGNIREYHYEDNRYPNYLTGITDERDIRYATWTYNTEGRTITSEHANGVEKVTITYNADGSVTTTDSRNTQTTYHFTTVLGVNQITQIDRPATATTLAASRYFTYDITNGQLSTKTNWNGILTEFGGYDSNNNLGYEIIAKDTPEQRRTDYKYEDTVNYNKVTRTIEPSVYATNPTAQCTEGTDCKITTYTYDNYGNRTSVIITGYTPTGTPVTRATHYQYNGPLHQLSQIDGPRTDVADITTLNYYPNDATQGNNRARLKEIINANSVTVRGNIQYTATGKVDAEDRPNGLSLSYTYTPGRDRLETLTETADSISRTTRWSYLPTGEVKTITQAYGTADATTITFGYDDARRLIRITDGLDNYIEYTLDTEGNKEDENIHDNTGALKKAIHRVFDTYNRLDTQTIGTQPQHTIASDSDSNYNPDGTLGTLIDGKNSQTSYQYDGLKRLTKVIQNFGTNPAAPADPIYLNAQTKYGYDVQDNLTSVTDPNNGNTTYVYDDLGNLLSQSSPDTGTTTFTYDEAGNLKSKTDAKGQLFNYTYDKLNHLALLDAPGTEDDISYRYDSCTQGTGRLCHVTMKPQSATPIEVSYSYNGFGDVITHQNVGYSYDNAGRLRTITYLSGAIVTYSYDAAGQIKRVVLEQAGQTTTLAGDIDDIQYHPFGAIRSLRYGNGLTLNQAVDNAYQMAGINTGVALDINNMHYDQNGNLTNRDNKSVAENFTYDALNRLETANGNFGVRSYDHDKNGNRTQQEADTVMKGYGYEPQSNRIANAGTTSYGLDANGNTLTKGDWQYEYNAYNRLKLVTYANEAKVQYLYNGLGQRTIKYLIQALPGDTNEDQRVDWVDYLLETYWVSGKYGLPITNADCNEDGLINNQDLECINSQISTGTGPAGDIDKNGAITLDDYWYLYIYLMGQNNQPLPNGDCNSDGAYDAPDYYCMEALMYAGEPIVQERFSVYGLQGELLGEYSEGVMIQETIYLNGQPLAVIKNSGLYYIHNDHLGTPQTMTNTAGAVVWRATYDPFGAATVDEDVDGDGQKVTLNLRFPGQYFDKETGLLYNYFRTYDPATGRYITSDPIGLEGGLNTYGYVGGNPILRFDLFGLRMTAEQSQQYYNNARANNPLPPHVPQGSFGFGGQVGTTTYGPNGWGQTSSIGGAIYYEVCEKQSECSENTGLMPDSVTGSWGLVGATIRADGTVCFMFGLIFTWPPVIPSANWNLPN